MKKTLPELTWQNAAPPYTTYEYFQHHSDFPFRPYAEHFELVNAWWLSEAATLVYADEEFVRPQFEQVGMGEVRYFSGKSTDCFVVSHADYIWVVFRGTEIRRRSGATDFGHILADIKADCNILLVNDKGGKGKVHKGFHNALDEIWEALREYISDIRTNSQTLWIAGHSLGAALATLTASRLRDVRGVYTFGSPRVGDTEFRDYFPARLYRIVNGHDVITSIPFPGIYQHVGKLWSIDSAGHLQQRSRHLDVLTDSIRGEVQNIIESLQQIGQGSFSFIPGGMKDHIPLLYTVYLWNNLVATTS